MNRPWPGKKDDEDQILLLDALFNYEQTYIMLTKGNNEDLVIG